MLSLFQSSDQKNWTLVSLISPPQPNSTTMIVYIFSTSKPYVHSLSHAWRCVASTISQRSGLGADVSFFCLMLSLTDFLYQDWLSQQRQRSGAALHRAGIRSRQISTKNITCFFAVPQHSIFEWWHGLEVRWPCDESSGRMWATITIFCSKFFCFFFWPATDWYVVILEWGHWTFFEHRPWTCIYVFRGMYIDNHCLGTYSKPALWD